MNTASLDLGQSWQVACKWRPDFDIDMRRETRVTFTIVFMVYYSHIKHRTDALPLNHVITRYDSNTILDSKLIEYSMYRLSINRVIVSTC